MLKHFLAFLLFTSAMINVHAAGNSPPTVAMTATVSSAASPGTISLSATASDDATIAKVEFFNGTSLLATMTQMPYAYTWSNVPAGTYSLTARATDNKGAATTTQPTVVTIAAGVAQMYYVYADQVNTPREITNVAGVVIWRGDPTEPFGANAPNENPSGYGAFSYNPRFAGQYYDKETNLHYNYYRDYDPAIGRYIQSDPIGLDAGINTYAYVGNQPTMLTDPRGLAPTKAVIWLVKICKKGIQKIRPVNFEEAVNLAKKGEDLQSSRDTAKQIANAASEGRGAIKDPVHPDRTTGSTEGRLPHYHANPRNGGHIFYSIATAATVAGHVHCDDCIWAYVAEGVDFFNPLSLPKDLMDLTGIGAPE